MAATDPTGADLRPPTTGPVPEGGGGVDLTPDVERLHRAIRREPHDPVEGREPTPWIFTAAIAISLFWGGWYLGRYGGEWGLATHIAFAERQPGIAASAAAQATAAVTDPVASGKRVFEKNCVGCHQSTGQGIAGAFPPLVGSAWVTGSPETVARILLHGLQGPVEVAGTTYNGAMPAWKDLLKDEEVAAVATYIRQWAPNSAPAVSTSLVAAIRSAGTARTAAWTVTELRSGEAGDSSATAPADTPSRKIP